MPHGVDRKETRIPSLLVVRGRAWFLWNLEKILWIFPPSWSDQLQQETVLAWLARDINNQDCSLLQLTPVERPRQAPKTFQKKKKDRHQNIICCPLKKRKLPPRRQDGREEISILFFWSSPSDLSLHAAAGFCRRAKPVCAAGVRWWAGLWVVPRGLPRQRLGGSGGGGKKRRDRGEAAATSY